MRAGIYARVSTAQQSADMQLAELRQFCDRRGWTYTEYLDAGVSGSKERRPELDRMLTDCQRRKLDVVLVWKFDRLARSLRQLINTLEELRTLGVQFVSLSESLDTSTPQGRFAFSVFASVAEFERELTRERVRTGLAHAKAKGIRLGRPPEEVDVSRIQQLRKQGMGWKRIGRELGISTRTARRRDIIPR